MPKRQGEGPKGPVWKNPQSPEEIARRNEESAQNLGIDMEAKGIANRDLLLAGINKEIIAITRKKAEAILAATTKVDSAQAEKLLDSMIKNNHPKAMITVIHGTNEEIRSANPIGYAAMAFAFLALTEDS
jgi:hypothetical protein